jgi:hypothetical protein
MSIVRVTAAAIGRAEYVRRDLTCIEALLGANGNVRGVDLDAV